MTRYAKTMSQALAEVQVRELKMNDPKLIKVFDKLKPKDTIKLKVSSGISKGKDFQPYTVRAKNTLRNGVEKITMILQGNPTGVKRFLYKKDGKVTFAIGDMAASIDDIKEEVIHELVIEEVATEMSYKPGSFKDTRPQEKGAKAFDKLIQSGGIDKKTFQKARQLYVQASDPKSRMKLRDFIYNMDTEPLEAVMDLIGRNDPETFVRMYPDADEGERLSTISFRHKQKKIKTEEVELDEGMKYTHVAVDKKGLVIGFASDEKDAKDMARRNDGKVVKLKKPMSDKKGDMMVNRPFKEDLGKEDEPKVKEIIKKLKGASQAHAGQAKDLEKAVNEDSKGKEMSNEKMTDGNLSLKETVLKMWQEAVSPAQQAAIAISKKEKEKKEEPDEGNLFTKALKDARDKGEKTFTVAGKKYDVKTEKLVGGQKKLDKDKDGDIDGKDFAMLRKAKKEQVEFKRYHETKQGSLRESILKMWGEVAEEGYKPIKANHYDVKVTVKDKDVAKVKKIISNFKGDIEDVDSDQVDGGGMKFKGTGDIFIQGDDAGKLGMEIAKAVRTAKVMGEDKNLTKNEKHGKNKMTDTGKEMTPVDMAPKMPKIKNEKNKV